MDMGVSDPAARAKSIVLRGAHVQIGLLNHQRIVPRHLVDTAGSLVMRGVDAAGPCLRRLLEGAPAPTLHVMVDDVSPVPQPDRLRARVRLSGTLERIQIRDCAQALAHLGAEVDEPLVRLRPEWLQLRDPAKHDVPMEAYRMARPDPLCGWEAEWLTELNRSDPDLIRLLAATETTLGPADRVCLLGADSAGIDLRLYRNERSADLRLLFVRPAGCPCQARRAFDEMVNSRL